MRIRLVIFILIGLSLAPFLVSQILVAEKNMQAAIAVAEQSVQLSLARTEDLFVGAKVELENLSSTVALIDSLRFTSPEQCNRTLQKIVDAHDKVKAIALLTPQGTSYCASETKAVGMSFSERQYFKDSVRSSEITWGDLQISKVNDQVTAVSARAVRHDGGVSFIVLVTLDVASMKRQTFEQFQLHASQAILVNGQGEMLDKLVFDQDAPPFDDHVVSLALAMGTGIIPSMTKDRDSTLVGVVKVPMAAGRIIFAIPIGQIRAVAYREMLEVIALGCLETLLIAAFLLVGLEFLVLRSLRQITAFASLIAAGKQSQRVTIRSPFAEFAILSSTLNLMVDKLERASFTDALTGLSNRRALEGHLKRCDERLESTGVGFAVAMIDIDHFKRFNDRFGHGTGDSVLQTVGKTLKSFTESSNEMAARYGGEEFTLVLSDTCTARVADRLETLRHAIEELDIAHPDSRHGRVTISIGFAIVGPDGRAQQALERADRALYGAKERGRNRVVSEEPSTAGTPRVRLSSVEDALS